MLNRDSFYVCSNCGETEILKIFCAIEGVLVNDLSDGIDSNPYWADTDDYECAYTACSELNSKAIEVGKLSPLIPVGSLVEIEWGENKQRWAGEKKEWRPSAGHLQGIITKINEQPHKIRDADGLLYEGKLGFYSVTIMTSPYEYEKETTITIADIGKVLSRGS
jgi:hypothetical protein|tara:strand:- start:409 stop:900 length:492 start_codon:yes stop_codon:yes gene_type:complete